MEVKVEVKGIFSEPSLPSGRPGSQRLRVPSWGSQSRYVADREVLEASGGRQLSVRSEWTQSPLYSSGTCLRCRCDSRRRLLQVLPLFRCGVCWYSVSFTLYVLSLTLLKLGARRRLCCCSRQMYTLMLSPGIKWWISQTTLGLHFLSNLTSGYMKNMNLEN